MNLNTVIGENQETGYGRMGTEFVRSFRKLGVELDPVGEESWRQFRKTDATPLGSEFPVHANALWMGAPSHVGGWWEGQRTHVLTMWEATGVPPGFRENVHEIDTMIVPSEQNRELFSHWHKNVKKVPLGVNPDHWNYRERPPLEDTFRFMTAGQGNRKGIDICTKAFSTVFGGFQPSVSHPRPVLVVKDRTRMKDVKSEWVHEVTGTIPLADEITLYGTAHCFLGLARGEGWGMMPFQAMAQGTPTILANAHGYAEFAHLTPMTVSCGMSKAEPFIFGDADMWWEPNFEEVCELMWEAYVNYESYLQPAKEAAAVIGDTMTWDCAASKLIEAMGGVDALELPDITERIWHKPTIQQFWVVPDKNCSYEVNGVTHSFAKGEDYWVFGDLKRMMYENGNLDPSCLRDIHESGLTPEQLSDLDRYRSQKARCHACGQRLNIDDTLDFDDLEEDLAELSP
jgi:hypothetical protein